MSNDALDRPVSTSDPSAPSDPNDDRGGTAYRYAEVQQSAEFKDLKARFRRFVFPLTGLFLAWYFVYVLLSSFAPAFMSTKLFGDITVGLVFGLLQFVTTFAITIAYVRWADRHFDPAAERLREQVEGVR